ncbi:hypothetical protein JCM31598_38480 [Desulfonatronum parangueonense]
MRDAVRAEFILMYAAIGSVYGTNAEKSTILVQVEFFEKNPAPAKHVSLRNPGKQHGLCPASRNCY